LDPFGIDTLSTGDSSPIKIALCDLDGCLIKTKGSSSFPRNRDDWEWWHPGVKKKMREWQDTGLANEFGRDFAEA
jgi:bifunctional polynucleotide phosphatase/kinase